MCFNLWRSAQTVAAPEAIIQNQTEDTIVLRDMHRYVCRQVRMELPPQESKKIAVKAPTTFFRMGVMLKLDDRHEKDLKIYIVAEQLVDRNTISICKDENGGYYLEESNSNQ